MWPVAGNSNPAFFSETTQLMLTVPTCRKMSFTLVTVLLLCSLSWIHLSLADTVEAQSGEDVTLLCSNFSTIPALLSWGRFINKMRIQRIASIYSSNEAAKLYSGAERDKFEVTSNMTTVFLKIKRVNESDSGLYFCGYYVRQYLTITSSKYLEIQEKPVETTSLTTIILSGLTLILTKITICVIIKFQTDMEFMRSKEEQQ